MTRRYDHEKEILESPDSDNQNRSFDNRLDMKMGVGEAR
jgi:hypothetical protein